MGRDKPQGFCGKNALNCQIFIISYLQFMDIMHKDLQMKKVCAHWVLRDLTQKQMRVDICHQLLTVFSNIKDALCSE